MARTKHYIAKPHALDGMQEIVAHSHSGGNRGRSSKERLPSFLYGYLIKLVMILVPGSIEPRRIMRGFSKKRETIGKLEPGLSVFREAFLAIDRSSLSRLERYFAIFSTI